MILQITLLLSPMTPRSPSVRGGCLRWSLRSLADHLILQFVLYPCQDFMFLKSPVGKYGVGGNDTVLNNQNGFCPHLRANPQRRRKQMSQGLNMNTVTVRQTLQQTAESFVSWPACHEKGRPAKASQQSRPELWLTLIVSSPCTTHTSHTGKWSLCLQICAFWLHVCSCQVFA